MNPLLFVMHGHHDNWTEGLTRTGKSQANNLAKIVPLILRENYCNLTIYYGDDVTYENAATASIVADEIGALVSPSPHLSSQEKGTVPGTEQLEIIVNLYEEAQKEGPVMFISNKNILEGAAPFLSDHYRFARNLKEYKPSECQGLLYDFDANTIFRVPSELTLLRR